MFWFFLRVVLDHVRHVNWLLQNACQKCIQQYFVHVAVSGGGVRFHFFFIFIDDATVGIRRWKLSLTHLSTRAFNYCFRLWKKWANYYSWNIVESLFMLLNVNSSFGESSYFNWNDQLANKGADLALSKLVCKENLYCFSVCVSCSLYVTGPVEK